MREFVCQAVAEVEEDDWWHWNLREVVNEYLRGFLPTGGKILDVGCGGGYFLAQLGNIWQKWGVDADLKMVKKTKSRGIANVEAGKMEAMPFGDNFFDAVTALDVLEHVKDDRKGVLEMHRVTKPGGILILNVPAYQWLWSYHDESAQHVRRYTKRELEKLLNRSGWKVARATYTGLWLLPLVIVYRTIVKLRGAEKTTDVGVGRRWSGALRAISSLERWVLRFVDLPAGTSVSIAAQKSGF